MESHSGFLAGVGPESRGAFGVGYSRTLLEKRSVVSEGSIRASSCWGVRAGAAGVRAVELLGLWAVRAVSGRGVSGCVVWAGPLVRAVWVSPVVDLRRCLRGHWHLLMCILAADV